MARLRIDFAPPPPPPKASGWPTIRWVAWTLLLCAMVFWATLIMGA